MPTSEPQTIPYIINLVKSLQAKKILDVGCGFGKYGLLFREYLEVWNKRYDKKDWLFKIDALEAHKPYITPVHKHVYNKVTIGDLRKTNLSGYDLLFFGDVLEHIEKEEAFEVINKYREKSNIIICTPKGFTPQKAYNGNDYEIHRTGFTSEDFKQFKGRSLVIGPMLVVMIKCRA